MPTIRPIEIQIKAHLEADTTVSATLGIGASILISQLIQNYPRPNLVLTRVVVTPQYRHQGRSQLAYGRFNLTATSDTYGGAYALRTATMKAMDSFIPDGVTTANTKCVMDRPDMEPNQQPPLWRFLLDFTMWYLEED